MQKNNELVEEAIAIIIDTTDENDIIRIGQRYDLGEVNCLITHIESVAFINQTTIEVCVNAVIDNNKKESGEIIEFQQS